MNVRPSAAALLTLAVLASACTAYKIKALDGPALAAKDGRAKIVAVETKERSYEFPEDDPARIKDKAVIGNLYESLVIEPFEIADVVPSGRKARVVLKDGSRFQLLSSQPSGEAIKCETVCPTRIPLDRIVAARVRTVNTAGSILGTLGGIALFAGAVALDVITLDLADEDIGFSFTAEFIGSLFDSWLTSTGGEARPRNMSSLVELKGSLDPAAESELWVMEWARLDGAPGEDGKLEVRLGNDSGVPRGVDEVKLAVVDRPPGLGVAPDIRGYLRTLSSPVPPSSAADGTSRDVLDLVRAKDDIFWRTAGGDSAPAAQAQLRDAITLEFPKPADARRAKLVVNATNSTWRALFAREVRERSTGTEPAGPDLKKPPVYQAGEYTKLRVQLQTYFGWQTGQVIFGGGPLPAEDMVYDIDLSDVDASTVRLRLEPPAGYWLIDRLALDCSEDVPVEGALLDPDETDSPDAADTFRTLAAEDGSTLLFESPDAAVTLKFTVPPPKEGMERTLFLRTVSCYRMLSETGVDGHRVPTSPGR